MPKKQISTNNKITSIKTDCSGISEFIIRIGCLYWFLRVAVWYFNDGSFPKVNEINNWTRPCFSHSKKGGLLKTIKNDFASSYAFLWNCKDTNCWNISITLVDFNNCPETTLAFQVTLVPPLPYSLCFGQLTGAGFLFLSGNRHYLFWGRLKQGTILPGRRTYYRACW